MTSNSINPTGGNSDNQMDPHANVPADGKQLQGSNNKDKKELSVSVPAGNELLQKGNTDKQDYHEVGFAKPKSAPTGSGNSEDLAEALPGPSTTLKYIPVGSETEMGGLSVVRVAVVAHEKLENDDADIYVNHWAIYLELEDGNGSVRFDVTAAGAWVESRIRGVLVVSALPYIGSRNATKAVILESKGANVGILLWLILKAKMDEYVFTELGVGCRYWVLKVVELWKSAGLVSGGEGLQDAMEKVWGKHGNEVCAAAVITPGTWE